MQSIQTLTLRQDADYERRREALNETLERLLVRIFGCSHRDLSRPFTREGKSYRVCLGCGMARGFDLETWKTFGQPARIN